MSNDTRTIDLVINNLTEEQFENVFSPDPNELWVTPDNTPEQLAQKVDKTTEANKTYGTDAQGNQITYSTPTIPTVGNGTITITQGGITKGTFTTNQGSDATIALDAGGSNAAWGNISGTLSNQTDLQNALNNKVTTGHQIIAFQEPTSANNYTWYRKYADGWVEMGGITNNQTINLPITMANTNYFIQLTSTSDTTNNNVTILGYRNKTTTSFIALGNIVNNISQTVASNTASKTWQVSGIAAS